MDLSMVIVTLVYLLAIWLVFSKLKLVRLSWLSGAVAALVGVVILAVFLAFLNYLTPSGRIVVASRVVEVTPNVNGQVIAIPVEPNVPVKAGTILFQIDPVPYQHKVTRLEAALVETRQNAEKLKAAYEQASANVDALVAQLAYNRQRLADIKKLAVTQAAAEFRLQDTQIQVDIVENQLQAAKAAQLGARLALDSEIGGVNTSVIQIEAQLNDAKWELEQATIRAPADGYVTIMALAVGDRAVQFRSAMSFLLSDELTIIGLFPPNGFQTIKPGAAVTLVFDNIPGRRYQARIADIPRGIGQGQITVSGTLARPAAVGGTREFPATVSIPEGMDREQLRLGMPGTATVFADNAGVIGIISAILIWVTSFTAYL